MKNEMEVLYDGADKTAIGTPVPASFLDVDRYSPDGSAAGSGGGRSGRVMNERANFIRLVLGCIEAEFCNQTFVGKLSPRSTQSIPLHRSSISKFQPKIVNIFLRLNS